MSYILFLVWSYRGMVQPWLIYKQFFKQNDNSQNTKLSNNNLFFFWLKFVWKFPAFYAWIKHKIILNMSEPVCIVEALTAALQKTHVCLNGVTFAGKSLKLDTKSDGTVNKLNKTNVLM